MNLLFPFTAMTCSRALANEWPLSAVTAPGLPAQFAAAPSTNILPLLCAGALYKMALKRRSAHTSLHHQLPLHFGILMLLYAQWSFFAV
ncbi:hypothetical protein T08_11907 [Trichinella sp. T8]|nr:hypothetical protein T08_4009 [Trichinella sp. T8]KRZ85055.1 hypothetical protein T08_11907 [Trichinella sp. T8]